MTLQLQLQNEMQKAKILQLQLQMENSRASGPGHQPMQPPGLQQQMPMQQQPQFGGYNQYQQMGSGYGGYGGMPNMYQPQQMGAQQMLLDMYNIKTQLLNLHSFGPDDNSYRQSGIPAMYEKLVTGRFARIEVVLKLVGTPEDEAMLVERFRIMWPEGNA